MNEREGVRHAKGRDPVRDIVCMVDDRQPCIA